MDQKTFVYCSIRRWHAYMFVHVLEIKAKLMLQKLSLNRAWRNWKLHQCERSPRSAFTASNARSRKKTWWEENISEIFDELPQAPVVIYFLCLKNVNIAKAKNNSISQQVHRLFSWRLTRNRNKRTDSLQGFIRSDDTTSLCYGLFTRLLIQESRILTTTI